MGNRQGRVEVEVESTAAVSGHRFILITSDDCGTCTMMKKKFLPSLQSNLDKRHDVKLIHINMASRRRDNLVPSSPVPLPNIVKEYVQTERIHLPCILMCPMNKWASHDTTKSDLDVYAFSGESNTQHIISWVDGLLEGPKYLKIIEEIKMEDESKPEAIDVISVETPVLRSSSKPRTGTTRSGTKSTPVKNSTKSRPETTRSGTKSTPIKIPIRPGTKSTQPKSSKPVRPVRSTSRVVKLPPKSVPRPTPIKISSRKKGSVIRISKQINQPQTASTQR